ncbi:MAG TPA: molybdenum cofactor guanylyltransferase [Thermoplasmata archaeon]|nr:molybdenum cofactor guanylyltransferase [Thermoplasmata archaeon]
MSALILAGGASSRFGKSKALVEVAGRPLLAHVAGGMRSLADETIVSVSDEESAQQLRQILPQAMFVQDERRNRGPIEGFLQGFRKARGEIVLVAPCDAPLIRPDTYRILLGVLRDHDAAVPRLDVFDPVRAVYRRSAVLNVLAETEVNSPSALVDRLRATFVGPDQLRAVDPKLDSFLDVNTRGDLEEVRRRIKSERSIRLRRI